MFFSAVALGFLAASPSVAASSNAGTAAFAVALGPAAYAVMADPKSVNGRLVVRRLALDGGLLWEQRWGNGREETPVQAVVTLSGTIIVTGDSSQGCFVARWNKEGRLLWTADLIQGTECRARTLVVDAENNSYVLGTTTLHGVVAATVWKLDRRGTVEWSARDDAHAPDYAFAIELTAKADMAFITTVRRNGSAWQYTSFALNPRGESAPMEHY